jgi:hypothetical protein
MDEQISLSAPFDPADFAINSNKASQLLAN